MKTILLLSSIFYILGLKLGHTIDIVKAPNTIQKITSTTNAVKSAAKSISFSEESKRLTSVDSLKTEKHIEKKDQQVTHF